MPGPQQTLTVKESDGSPSVTGVSIIQVSPGSLTDNGGGNVSITTGGGSGAPSDATYITQTPNASLSAEQALSTLGTGILKSTTATGVVSIAVAGDFPTLNQNTSGTAANLSGTPALPNNTTATTQSAADNSTKLATTAYADRVATPNITIPMILASVSVDLNEGTTAKQAIYTCPATFNGVAVGGCVITNIVMQKLSGNVTTAEFTLGWDAGASNLASASASINGPYSSNASLNFATPDATNGQNFLSSLPVIGTPSDVLGLKVNTPEGSARTARVQPIGYFVNTSGVAISNVVGVTP